MVRRLIAGGVLGLLWLACGLAPWVFSRVGGPLYTASRLVPSPMRGPFFQTPPLWLVTVHVLALVVVVAGFAVVASWFSRRGRVSFAAGWLSAILAGYLVGAVLDAGNAVVAFRRAGAWAATGALGTAEITVFWALAVGWLPALIVSLRRRGTDAASHAAPRERTGTVGGTAPGRAGARRASGAAVAAVTAIAVVAAVALPFAAQAARHAEQTQLRADNAQAQAEASARADPGGAAPRDPDAAGRPVPTTAAGAAAPEAGACTIENSTLLAPREDAATGHRLQAVRLVNSTEVPCTISGYPDVAFGDQNDHLLTVHVEHGSSFMATDAGPVTVTLGPGEAAQAGIGWDANAVAGSLAARTLWVAPTPGDTRLSWPVVLDIVPGTTVHVTAWAPAPSASGSD